MSGGTGWLRIHVWTAERTAVFSFSFNMPKKSDAATLPCICKSLLSIGQSSQTHRAFLQSYVTSPAPFHVLHADLRRSFMKGYRSPSPIFRLYEGIYEDTQKFFPKNILRHSRRFFSFGHSPAPTSTVRKPYYYFVRLRQLPEHLSFRSFIYSFLLYCVVLEQIFKIH